jgi:hypothetical protein
MTDRSRVEAGIDAAEEHAQVGGDYVGHGLTCRFD